MSSTVEDPLWFKRAIIYQCHVRAFYDANGDGIGDFRGLTQKLDYLADLGVTAIWVLPFYPSPLRDDGYDIADYTAVNPAYGNMRDVRRFIQAAHDRGLKVINELVLNHTSDQHPWFQRARRAKKGSSHRDFYVWSDEPDQYEGVRIIFKDFEASNWTYDSVAGEYFWHRFYHHQPDLNFDNPAVHKALMKVVDFWCEAGVDGMRLDAVPYLYEREGTSCENLPETHAFLKKLRSHLDRKYPGRMFLAEANQWPEDAAAYFGEGDGDECHMNFHFPLMPRLFMALRMEDRYPIIDILEQTPEIPEQAQWAMFLRNHDELTLEMVTDEERDYMYRAYAEDPKARINMGIRRRLAPLLGNSRPKIELLNALLFSIPGTPIIYYGDELGMGDNIYLGDRDGVRTPMQWSADRNAGFSKANPQSLYLPVISDPDYRFEAINVESQERNPSSLLNWMKRLIDLRRRNPVFATGSIRFLDSDNRKILAFLRENGGSPVLVVANLSRKTQPVELRLREFREFTPVELFGHTRFPAIGELPYFLTLPPYGFYWFGLEAPTVDAQVDTSRPSLQTRRDARAWLVSSEAFEAMHDALLRDLPRRRWFRSKTRSLVRLERLDVIPIPVDQTDDLTAVIWLVRVEYHDGDPEIYVLPLALARRGHSQLVFGSDSPAVIAEVSVADENRPRLLYDATIDPAVGLKLLSLVGGTRRWKGSHGSLVGQGARRVQRLAREMGRESVRVIGAEQSNSSIIFGDELIAKIYRSVAAGPHPDLELTRHLTETARFPHTADLVGSISYQSDAGEDYSCGIVQRFVRNEGDGWDFTLDQLREYLDRHRADAPPNRPGLPALLRRENEELRGEVGFYAQLARRLGRRTAELHAALAQGKDAAFTPEEFTPTRQRSLYQSLRNSAKQSMDMLRRARGGLEDDAGELAVAVLERRSDIMSAIEEVKQGRFGGRLIRIHGDYHLGQVLWTGRDFLIIDFEGEPARPLSQRRLKWPALRDVAGMLRSFDYASASACAEISVEGEAAEQLQGWAGIWVDVVSASFLARYFEVLDELAPELLPEAPERRMALLNAWMLEKALYEVRYELDNRPGWATIPLTGVLTILDNSQGDLH